MKYGLHHIPLCATSNILKDEGNVWYQKKKTYYQDHQHLTYQRGDCFYKADQYQTWGSINQSFQQETQRTCT
ncbi:hypothetical protein Trydic_g12568 [Trypoxylus dichotomus]